MGTCKRNDLVAGRMPGGYIYSVTGWRVAGGSVLIRLAETLCRAKCGCGQREAEKLCCAVASCWNNLTPGRNVGPGAVIGVLTATAARSVALAGFGLDSLIEIGASVVVVLGTVRHQGKPGSGAPSALIGAAFGLLAIYLAVQSLLGPRPAAGDRPRHSMAGIGWTAASAAVMYALAAGKARTPGAAITSNPVLCTEGRVAHGERGPGHCSADRPSP